MVLRLMGIRSLLASRCRRVAYFFDREVRWRISGDWWRLCVLLRFFPLQGYHLSQEQQVAIEVSNSVRPEWLAAICYATIEGSPHPLRNALSKYIDLPDLVPNPGPNAPNHWQLDERLYINIRIMQTSIAIGVMPERTADPGPDVGGLSISRTVQGDA